MNLLFSFWLVALLVKIFINLFVPLAPDEAYYWVWSQYLNWSYFDHPGMVAWLFHLGKIFSFLPQGERLPGIILNHAGVLIWFKILQGLWSEKLTWTWFLLFLGNPFLGLGSIVLTPDLPVLFFWVLSLYFFMLCLEKDHWIFAVALGLSLGLGFCSKYHITLFVPSALIYLLAEKKFDRIRFSSVALVVVAGAAASFPVFYWNLKNDWMSFVFQLNHGLGQEEWQPHWTSDYIIGQSLLFFPSLFFLYFKGYRYRQLRIFFWFSLIPWAVFLLSSFRGAVQANCPIIYFASALVVVIGAHQSWKHLRGVITVWTIASLSVLILWLFPIWEGAPQKLREVHLLRSIVPEIKNHQPLYAGSYQIASILWYYSGHPLFKVRGLSRPDFFDSLPESVPSQATFYLVKEKTEDLPHWLKKDRQIESVKEFERYEIVRVSP